MRSTLPPGKDVKPEARRELVREMLTSCPVVGAGLQSVLLVEVPEAEPAVARHWERLDANALLGIPAHVTVLFPFMAPQMIGPPVLADLERLFAAVRRFRFELARTDWFGDEVLSRSWTFRCRCLTASRPPGRSSRTSGWTKCTW
jgi:hypothetical protein